MCRRRDEVVVRLMSARIWVRQSWQCEFCVTPGAYRKTASEPSVCCDGKSAPQPTSSRTRDTRALIQRYLRRSRDHGGSGRQGECRAFHFQRSAATQKWELIAEEAACQEGTEQEYWAGRTRRGRELEAGQARSKEQAEVDICPGDQVYTGNGAGKEGTAGGASQDIGRSTRFFRSRGDITYLGHCRIYARSNYINRVFRRYATSF